MIRKFEFPNKELAEQFIATHQSKEERRDFIGPMQIATAWEGEGEERVPSAFTGWMVDTDQVDPLPGWEAYEVTPTKPMHQIIGRELEYKQRIESLI